MLPKTKNKRDFYLLIVPVTLVFLHLFSLVNIYIYKSRTHKSTCCYLSVREKKSVFKNPTTTKAKLNQNGDPAGTSLSYLNGVVKNIYTFFTTRCFGEWMLEKVIIRCPCVATPQLANLIFLWSNIVDGKRAIWLDDTRTDLVCECKLILKFNSYLFFTAVIGIFRLGL